MVRPAVFNAVTDALVQDHVHHLVELMAGEASRSLTDEVTHLVAGEVGSQKYAVSGLCMLLLPDIMKNLWGLPTPFIPP